MTADVVSNNERLHKLSLGENCQFIIKKKNRFCRMNALPGEAYCGEHIVLFPNTVQTKNGKNRVTCPLDPSHTCLSENLPRHLRRCNARAQCPSPAYFRKEINAGEPCDLSEAAVGCSLHKLSDLALLQLLTHIERVYDDRVPCLETINQSHTVTSQFQLNNTQLGAESLRHLRQNSAILAIMESNNLLCGQKTYVEFGSGRAWLSYWLSCVIAQESRIILVDRDSPRHKSENKLKNSESAPCIERLRVDIRDFDVRAALSDTSPSQPVVAVSKHLCGNASDMALRSLVGAMTPGALHVQVSALQQNCGDGRALDMQLVVPVVVPELESCQPPAHVKAVVMALCCHHRIDWRSFVGKQFLIKDCGFQTSDFEALRGIAAWATCSPPAWSKMTQKWDRDTDYTAADLLAQFQSSDTSDTSADITCGGVPASNARASDCNMGRYQRLGLSPLLRTRIGSKCKQILDTARVSYMQQSGFTCRLLKYVPASISLENILLLATRDI